MVQPEAGHWGHKPPTRLGKMEKQGHPQKAWSKGGPWGALDQGQRARLECRPSHSLPTFRSKGSFLTDSGKAPRGSPKLGEWLAWISQQVSLYSILQSSLFIPDHTYGSRKAIYSVLLESEKSLFTGLALSIFTWLDLGIEYNPRS